MLQDSNKTMKTKTMKELIHLNKESKQTEETFILLVLPSSWTKVVLSFSTIRAEKPPCHANINPNKMCIYFQDKLWKVNVINILKWYQVLEFRTSCNNVNINLIISKSV